MRGKGASPRPKEGMPWTKRKEMRELRWMPRERNERKEYNPQVFECVQVSE